MEEIVSLAKRRGFFYPSSEIYGGMANTWDFGHYGALLKNNLRDAWWKRFILTRPDMVGIEASTFLNPKVWEASGHVAGFTDVLIEDFLNKASSGNKTIESTEISEEKVQEVVTSKKVEGLKESELDALIHGFRILCPKCGQFNWTPVRKFNLLFETSIGIVEESKSKAYLRGEIAQGIFLNFKNVLDSMRVRIPFGIGQVGKAFRNEITMGQSIFRTLEFDLMEFEYFIKETEWEKTFEYWQNELKAFSEYIGIDQEKLRWREHEAHERSHYSTRTVDLEYNFPFGWKEMWAVAYRTDFDLTNHAKHSGVDLQYRDPETNEKFIPHVIEPTFGLSRLVLVILQDAYREEEVNGKKRIYLKLDPKIAPIKAAIFPLQKDQKLRDVAQKIYDNMKNEFTTEFDDAGNIGKMYRRQDEIGTPFCITVDYATLEDNTVTVRERDSMKQERIPFDTINSYISGKIL